MDACLLSWRWFFWYIDIDTWRQRYDDAPYDVDLYLDVDIDASIDFNMAIDVDVGVAGGYKNDELSFSSRY